MHVNGLPVLYVGEVHAANYSIYVEYFLSIRHAKEFMEDMMFACEDDAILLFKCDPHDSEAEAYSRTLIDSANAYGILKRGPRGGVRLERI